MSESNGKKAAPIKVAISIPTMGYCQVEAYCNRLMNFMHLGKLEEYSKSQTPTFQFFFTVIGKIFTPLAREKSVELALQAGCDWLLMVDDDMICPDDMFERLYVNQKDICAALAFTRNAPHKPVLYSQLDGYDHVSKKDYMLNTAVMNYPKDQLVECDAVGFGAVLLRIDMFRKMPQPWFMSTCGTGEDIYFCYQARKHGYRVFMDTRVKLGHLGHPVNVTEDYVEEHRRKEDPLTAKRFGEYRGPADKEEATVVLGE